MMGMGIWAMAAVSLPALAAPASGVASFDVAAVSATLQSNTSNFSGWSYSSESSSSYAKQYDSSLTSTAHSNATVSAGSANTTAGRLFTSALAGATSTAYQRVSASFELAAGQHLIYEIPYSLVFDQAIATQRLDLGVAFRLESDDSLFTVFRSGSTMQWPTQGGYQSENSTFLVELLNTRDVAQTYTIVGTLRADDISTTLAVVPEPATYAMLLLGLGLVGAVARTRTRAA
jgi:hypothetical protein